MAAEQLDTSNAGILRMINAIKPSPEGVGGSEWQGPLTELGAALYDEGNYSAEIADIRARFYEDLTKTVMKGA